jgi:hypothetical protein
MELRTIYFNEKLHKYTDEFNNPYISVTTLVSKYHEEFDIESNARRCALAGQRGNPKYAGKTIEQIKNEWEKAKVDGCERGNIRHDYLEDIVKRSNGYKKIEGSLFINDRIYTIPDILDNPSYGRVDLDYFKSTGLEDKYPTIYKAIESLVKAGYFIYSEIGVYNSDFLISGLIDILAIKGKSFLIIDWKTNKAPIKFESGWWEKDRDGKLTGAFIENNKYFKYPLNVLKDSVGNHYTLQLSSYDYLTEQFGLTCQGNILYHIRQVSTFEEKVEVVPISYLKNEVYKLYNHYQLTKIRDTVKQYTLI